jgi:hypothetical protein
VGGDRAASRLKQPTLLDAGAPPASSERVDASVPDPAPRAGAPFSSARALQERQRVWQREKARYDAAKTARETAPAEPEPPAPSG